MAETNLVQDCRTLLDGLWREVMESAERRELPADLPEEEIREAVKRSVNCSIKTYRYVLPAQLLAKLADPALDCRCLQAARGGPGAFDARTVAHQVIVPFDQQNERVLGGSAEPYVSNPLRIPEISPSYRDAQKNKRGWDDLCLVLETVQDRNDPAFTCAVFGHVLQCIYERLGQARVTYPAPRRISLDGAIALIEGFIAERSGGDRFEAVTTALFLTVGRQFGLFSDVRRAKVTAADVAAGMLCDIECINDQGEIVLVVEAKDRDLTITQLQDKIPGIREHKVSEAFFVAGRGVRQEDAEQIEALVRREFVSGQNIYITDLISLARVLLAIIGEPGRRTFLELVGSQLDAYSDIQHRRAWAQWLATV